MSGIARAMLELALAGGFCGALGFWVLSERLAYAAESLAHGLLPGLVLAAIAGAPLLLGAAAGACGGRGADRARGARPARRTRTPAPRWRSPAWWGLGSLLALEPDAPQRLEELLFGDPLGVTDGDLAAAALLLALGGAALVALRRPLAATAFDSAGAAALRLRPALVRLALLGLLAAAIAVAVQGLGALLVLAVLVAPALAVRRHARTPRRRCGRAPAVAAVAGVAGIQLSALAGTAAGASVRSCCARPRLSRGALPRAP